MGDSHRDCGDPGHHHKGCRCKCCRPLVFVFIYFDPSQSHQALDMVRDLARDQLGDGEGLADF